MTEQLSQHQFAIEAATEADVAGIGQAHLQATLETYPNEAAGIDAAWLTQEFAHFAKPSGDVYRRKTVGQAETNPDLVLYDVVKNIQGQVVGFIHATRGTRRAKLEGLYLVEEARGTGVSDELMQRALDFADGQPMVLEVVDYNQRAIRFYERYGFEEVPDSHRFRNGKLPIMDMRRAATEEPAA